MKPKHNHETKRHPHLPSSVDISFQDHTNFISFVFHWLVGGWPTPLKNMKVNEKDYIYYGQKKMFETANQLVKHIFRRIHITWLLYPITWYRRKPTHEAICYQYHHFSISIDNIKQDRNHTYIITTILVEDFTFSIPPFDDFPLFSHWNFIKVWDFYLFWWVFGGFSVVFHTFFGGPSTFPRCRAFVPRP